MTDNLVVTETLKDVTILTLNAPERLNALSDAMLAALRDALKAVHGDSSVRVVILRGAGKAFCAGHDLQEIQSKRSARDGGEAAFRDLFNRCTAVMNQIRALPQPVIAEVQGVATAAGCQLVAGCDLGVAASNARFGVNGINIGLFCSTPMVPLSRNIPRKAAFEMLATGQFISAERAAEIGLINHAVPAEELSATTLQLARTLASKLPAALALGKAAFYLQSEQPPLEAWNTGTAAIVANLMLPDTSEGLDAFLAKRPPAWAQDPA